MTLNVFLVQFCGYKGFRETNWQLRIIEVADHNQDFFFFFFSNLALEFSCT